MKILLGWELGAGQGHVQRLVAIAQALESHGYIPIFALKSYHLKGLEFRWQTVAAPRPLYSGRENSYTFADILATFGFDDPLLLGNHLHAWRDTLNVVQPDLIITDHAPGLVLAAYGQIPTVVIGSHFTVPPPIEQFPIIRFPAPPESEDYQIHVSETVRKLVKLDRPLGEALNGDRSFIFSLPQLDCYHCWRKKPTYVGIHIAPIPTIQSHGSQESWAYLAQDYPFRDLVLNTLNPNAEFKPLHDALVEHPVAIHHGGLTTSIACLFAGIPQLLFPRHLEQELTAIALAQLGVAVVSKNPTWDELLIAHTEAYSLREKAWSLAHSLQNWNQNFEEAIVQTCLELLRH